MNLKSCTGLQLGSVLTENSPLNSVSIGDANFHWVTVLGQLLNGDGDGFVGEDNVSVLDQGHLESEGTNIWVVRIGHVRPLHREVCFCKMKKVVN